MANSPQDGANPTSTTPRAITAIPNDATFAEVNRAMSGPAVSPASSAANGIAATASPSWVLDRPRSALICGKRGSRLA